MQSTIEGRSIDKAARAVAAGAGAAGRGPGRENRRNRAGDISNRRNWPRAGAFRRIPGGFYTMSRNIRRILGKAIFQSSLSLRLYAVRSPWSTERILGDLA